MKLTKFRADRRVRDEGVWVDLPGREPTSEARVRVRSEDYEPYRRAITKIVEDQQQFGRYSRRQQARLGDPVKFDEERGRAIAKFLLVDWQGLEDESGASIAFSVSAAEQFLTDPDYRDFYLAVSEAIDLVTDRKVDWETEVGKSSATESSTT